MKPTRLISISSSLVLLAGSASSLSAQTIAHYRFEGTPDGAIATATDSSGNSNTLNLATGTATYNASVAQVKIDPGQLANSSSAATSGGAYFVDANPAASLLGTTSFLNFTIEGWVNFGETRSGVESVVGKVESATGAEAFRDGFYLNSFFGGEFRLEAATIGGDYIVMNTSGDGTIGATVIAAANTWYHVAAVGDAAAGTLSLYINGELKAQKTGYDGLYVAAPAANSRWLVGASAINDGLIVDQLSGMIDEVRFSNVALPPEEFLRASAADDDGDGLPDSWEIANFGDLTSARGTQAQDPSLGAEWDNDGDGFSNLEEFQAGSDPTDPASVPGDIDADGFDDEVELLYFGNLSQGPDDDFDGDFTSNIDEINAGTSPTNANDWPDIDDDGMADGWELANGLDVGVDDADLDPDGDDFSNIQEFLAGSDPQDPEWTPEHAVLAHRWSFNGDLTDSVGGSDAQILNNDVESVGQSSVLDDSGIELYGGDKAFSDYVLLGNNLLSDLQADGVKPVTIELWATQNAVLNWSRIWDFGNDINGDPGPNGSLRMTWSTGTDPNTDQVEWAGNGAVWNSNAPYQTGAPHHIVMTIVPAVYSNGAIDVGSQVTWYSAPAAGSQPEGHPLLGARGTFNTTADLRSLIDSVGYLGRSMWPDAIAAATYDEFRIWKGALTKTERELFQLLGPDNIDRTDADGDGFPDQWELVHFGNTTTATVGADSDGDGENDEVELAQESEPSNPLSVGTDRDGDGLPDEWELQYFNNLLQGASDDPDLDFSDNADEFAFGTDPTDPDSSPDTDGDGIPDGWEMYWFGDLTTADSTQREGGVDTNFDGDFDTDLEEFLGGFDPLDRFSGRDTENGGAGDGLPDYWEFFYFEPHVGANYLNIVVPSQDFDGDGATNAEEFADGTDPADADDFRDDNGDGYFDGIALAATDALGVSSFNAGTNWPGAVAPVGGKNYMVANGLTLRTPNVAGQTTTFAGRRLVFYGGQLWLKGGNSIASANYVLDGATIRNAEDVGLPITVAGTIEAFRPSVLHADNGTLVVAANVTGNAGLTLRGNATVIREIQFTGAANTWTGDLTLEPSASLIVNGTLTPGAGSLYQIAPRAGGVTNSIGGTGNLTLAGTMDIDLAAAVPTAEASSWNLITATPTFDPGFTVTGSGFTSDGGAVGSRVWTDASGDYTFDESTGVLTYTGSLEGYVTWSAGAGLTAGVNDGPAQNPDGDGYANLLEYQLGGDPLAFDGDLVAVTESGTHLVFAFDRLAGSAADSTLDFRWAADLATWNTVPIGPTSSGPDANGVIVTVTAGGGAAAGYDRIEVQLPKSNAAGGKLFGQLQAAQP